MNDYLDIISLGAGVQSSTMLMMADRGLIKINGETIIPKYAIMSDTGNEPKKVYEWLEYLQSKVENIEIVLTNNGHITNDILNGIKNNDRFASVPFFTKAKDGSKGILWRQCTGEYKIKAVRKEIRRLLGYGPRQRVKENVRLWMGISTDEIQRVKPSQVNYIENYFPLIEYEMSRADCLKWFLDNEMPMPPRSSCIICPYHSNDHWRDMKLNDPESWKSAVVFDRKIRRLPKVDADVFLHRQCVPLDQVDFGEEQIELFDEECEGMCGI
ncbi:hypothetical protein MOC17_16265 [Bacillus haynesii]|uniref:hypothetical protein n=1 Tax=Bacillus haynesii TaxID=1925021 RepID=UPI0022814AC5|nr:hypothetical protein [Bacillus haynesii]MCY8047624.1 hypothetical protein [Bacillus haynesii]